MSITPSIRIASRLTPGFHQVRLRRVPSAPRSVCAAFRLRRFPSAPLSVCAAFRLRRFSSAPRSVCAAFRLRRVPGKQPGGGGESDLAERPGVRCSPVWTETSSLSHSLGLVLSVALDLVSRDHSPAVPQPRDDTSEPGNWRCGCAVILSSTEHMG
ncbi:hypothetical protein NQZ68_031125 [Dissostichus eleginoides]|nr:hypothetical protein NQZ68_031125 [Dissostichus eleginoides]